MNYISDYNYEELHEDAVERILGYIKEKREENDNEFDRELENDMIGNLGRLEMYTFPQVWSNTSLGWGGIAGQVICDAQTVVFLDRTYSIVCVYIGGKYAYMIEMRGKKVIECISNRRFPGVIDVRKEFGDEVIDVNRGGR